MFLRLCDCSDKSYCTVCAVQDEKWQPTKTLSQFFRSNLDSVLSYPLLMCCLGRNKILILTNSDFIPKKKKGRKNRIPIISWRLQKLNKLGNFLFVFLSVKLRSNYFICEHRKRHKGKGSYSISDPIFYSWSTYWAYE